MREYYNVYQNSMKLIAEEQRKQQNMQTDVQFIMDEVELPLEDSTIGRSFR